MWNNFATSNKTLIQVKTMENNLYGILALFGLAKLILSQLDNLFTLFLYPLCIVDFACSCALGWSGEACDIDCGCNNHSTCLTGQGACDDRQGYITGMQVSQSHSFSSRTSQHRSNTSIVSSGQQVTILRHPECVMPLSFTGGI